MTRIKPSPRARFAHMRPMQLRWNDNDVYGHMNNAVHFQLFDSAVNDWMLDQKILDFHMKGPVFLVVSTSCQYFAEIAYPAQAEVAIGITRLGGSSITYRLGLFHKGGDQAVAEGEFVHVNVDPATHKPMPIAPAHRALFETLLID